MKIFRENNYSFVCNWMKTRNGFKHTCSVYNDATGEKMFETKICYLNRTWESFEFESVLNKAKALLKEEK